MMASLLPAPKTEKQISCTQLDEGDIEYTFIKNYFTNEFPAQVLKIEKLRNRSVQKKFLTELKLSCEKYKDRSLTQLIKLLFHGCKNTKPEEIYNGNQGLDMRFS